MPEDLTRDLRRLSRHAAAADTAGWLQPAQRAVIHRRGWLRLLAPLAAGGAEWPLPRMVRLEEAIAAADGSCGWAVTLCAGAGWFAGFLPPQVAREVIGTRRLCIAGSGAPTGFADRERGGWSVSGAWSFASGAPMATHFTFNAVLRERGEVQLDDTGAPRIRAFIVPAAEVSSQPGWFAIGMRGTGSHAYALQGVRVADAQGFAIDPAAATAPGRLYRFDFISLAWVTLAANLAGMARHFVALADGDGIELESAWQCMLAELDDAWSCLAPGGTLAVARQLALRQAGSALVQAARDTVDRLYPRCGLRAADTRTEINRVWRDFHTASQHALLRPAPTG